jgi:hypothetical protein
MASALFKLVLKLIKTFQSIKFVEKLNHKKERIIKDDEKKTVKIVTRSSQSDKSLLIREAISPQLFLGISMTDKLHDAIKHDQQLFTFFVTGDNNRQGPVWIVFSRRKSL